MKKFWKIFGIAFGAVALIGGIYAYVVFNAATDLVEAVYNPVDRQEVRGEAVNLGDDPVSILLLGIDREEFQTGGRSDTMMVVTINPNENSAYILSLARDTFVTLAGRGTQERLNHAFAWGGPQMAIETIENFLNIPIDFYAELDMNGFGSLIDAVGGVTVENDFAFTFHNMHFPAGELTLTGEEALGFVRMRYEDPRGDFGRQLRQRSVVETLARGMISSGMTRFQQIFDAAEGYILTDLNMSNITNLLMNYSGAIRNVTQLDL
ncbi:MAG: LCP family protein, partial [Turicibacter sp.]|nr:LCP family protein [Turicibacter sp.]